MHRASSPRPNPVSLPVVALADEAATADLGGRVARCAEAGDVIALWGDLGAGKTVFARGFLRALGIEDEVPSPTFTLLQTYNAAPAMIYHFDLYRLESPDEVWELGIEDALAGGISVIEWPDRIAAMLPADRLDVNLDLATTGRQARLVGHGGWASRVGELGFDQSD
jgi:tRNA threonylcarbamoyladenosine biosynthesis protein TsaE